MQPGDSPKKYPHDFSFGHSLVYSPEPTPADLGGMIPGPRCSGLEIPARVLENRDAMSRLRRRGFSRFNIGELFDPGITRGIAAQNANIIGDFKRQFFRIIAEAPVVPECIIIDLGMDEAMRDRGFCDALSRLLLGMAMDLHMLDVRLALPVRIPGSAPGLDEFCLTLRNRLMLPRLCFSADIHPHELAMDGFLPEQLLRWLKFDLGTLRFFYEPATGNHIVPKAVTPWLDFLDQTSFDGLVTFCPRCETVESAVFELSAVQELLDACYAAAETAKSAAQ